MREYEELDHMIADSDTDLTEPSFYLPHHAVFKNDGSGKIRVVFNGSQKCKDGTSINDYLLSGRKLQQAIAVVLTLWRFYRYVFTADIVKMFRQILINPMDVRWQKIVWRSTLGKILSYFLLTVTYGTVSAPFLAIRCLLQLADDEELNYPLAAYILRKLTYVDDGYGGGDSIEEAIKRRDQFISILRSAGFELGKWAANDVSIFEGVTSDNRANHSLELAEVVSTLCLRWNTRQDCFFFQADLPESPRTITKRSVLSEIAKLFDPLGWLASLLITLKLFMQSLWKSKLTWDEPLTGPHLAIWLNIRDQLQLVSELRIPRRLSTRETTRWYLHGFSDASERAYAASVYLVTEEGESTLLMSKSRVAPVNTISLPRLELCAALLLVKLLQYVLSTLPNPPLTFICWSDSEVVLAWLNGHPSRWQVFVANRVSAIRSTLPQAVWRHVPSSDNPADCATRGFTIKQLADSKLWWHGPAWLSLSESQWPKQRKQSTDLEIKAQLQGFVIQDETSVYDSLSKFSFSKAERIASYIMKWRTYKRHNKGSMDGLSAEELATGRTLLIRIIQEKFFKEDLHNLRNREVLPKSSELKRLLPFIDERGVLRVGGRLHYSALPEDEKHPIVLPRKCMLIRSFVEEVHRKTKHGGPGLMQSNLNRYFWILRGRKMIAVIARSCITCAKVRAKTQLQQMAPLPAMRTSPQRPFSHTGLDYAGPILVRCSKGRGIKSYKDYIAIFICMVIKAVHVETVSDLTTETFLAAFRRFVNRRESCKFVYSDNGTTFQGASAELSRLFEATSSLSIEVAKQVARDGITWSFIPPRAPHFGGLWEAAVKSFKYHFKRAIGSATLTFEELSTLATEIEGCLNSRPLSPLSSDAGDLVALTPGHFLTGGPIIAPPEPFTKKDPSSLTLRWKRISAMRNLFWDRWRKETFNQIQQRNKWLNPDRSLQVDDIVLIKDEAVPPTKWPLGQITQLHPGADGLTRVVTIKTVTSEFQRPIVKVVRLPVHEDAVASYAIFLHTGSFPPIKAGGHH